MLRTVFAVVATLAPSCSTEPAHGAHAVSADSPTGAIALNHGGRIVLLDVATGAETVLIENNTYDRPLHWLATGDRLIHWNHDGGAWDLWSVDPESCERRNLTRSADDARSASSSPDGRTIAFQRGGQGVWLMDADGADQRRVHELGHRDAPPAWSPSGRLLAFTDLESGPGDSSALVAHVVEVEVGAGDGRGASRRLGGGEVLFFLDERRLVLAAAHGGRSELVVVDLTTGGCSPLTFSVERDADAVLSPDRRRIAWIECGEQASRLKLMDVDGGNVRDLAAIENRFAPPSFSCDGRWITFESGPARDALQVCLVSVDGGPVRVLTAAGGSFPVFRPQRRR